MFIPYEVDVPQDHRPVANWVLIAVTVAVFGWELFIHIDEKVLRPYALTGWDNPLGWVTSIFLHGGIIHVVGNMVFLWVFGNAVCGKLGNAVYPLLYVGLGIVAGFAHMAFDNNPAIGASGAINGIVGMYLVFFPLNTISCAYVFWWFLVVKVGTFNVSGYWMILFWLVFNIVVLALGGEGVAYWAHIGGFAAGVAIAIVLLKTKVVKMERDELSLLQVIGIDKKPELPEYDVFEHEGRQRGIMTVSREVAAAAELAALRRQMAASKPPILDAAPRPQSAAIQGEGQTEATESFVHFSCKCGKSIKAPVAMAGRAGRCPGCGEIVRIPSENGS